MTQETKALLDDATIGQRTTDLGGWTSGGPETMGFFDPTDINASGTATVYSEGYVRLELLLPAERAAEVVAYVCRVRESLRPTFVPVVETTYGNSAYDDLGAEVAPVSGVAGEIFETDISVDDLAKCETSKHQAPADPALLELAQLIAEQEADQAGDSAPEDV